MTTKIQPTKITEKLAATLQMALLASVKKYDMHHNIRIQISTKHNYKEHIPGKHYQQHGKPSHQSFVIMHTHTQVILRSHKLIGSFTYFFFCLSFSSPFSQFKVDRYRQYSPSPS